MAIDPKAFKQARLTAKLSQEALAQLAGVSQTTIDKIERGITKSSRHIFELAAALDVPVGRIDIETGKAIEQQPAVYRPLPQLVGERDLPVYSAAEGGTGEMVVYTDPIEMVPRPWFMRGKEGYAVLIVGDSMEPEFEPGDYALVNPRLPLIRGKPAIFIAQEDDGDFRASIKRLVRATETHWIVKQFNPAKELKLAKTQWPRAIRVIGKYGPG